MNPPDKAQARRSLAIFAVALVLLSAIIEGVIYRTGKDLESVGSLYVAVLMWTPFLASLAARLICREGFADISLRWGGKEGWRAAGLAFFYPLLVGALAYGFAWATGLARYELRTAGGATSSSPVAFLLRLLLNGGIGTLLGLVFATGEELGWRGYLLIRMRDAGLPRPILWGGVLWALWHMPLIVTGQYSVGANVGLSIPMFFLGVLAASYFFGYLRLRSGSVWPAAIAHAAYNAIIQGVFDVSTAGKSIWVGEGGIVSIAVEVALAAWVIRGTIVALRAPGQAQEELRVSSL